MLKKVMSNYHKSFCMGKSIFFVLVVLLAFSFVLAEDSWDSFEGGNGSSEVFEENLSNNLPETDSEKVEFVEDLDIEDYPIGDEDFFEYTTSFYVALGIGAVGLLIVVLFIYLFFKRPKNEWEK